jgi:transcriptional regulator with GAF, ATPase, and Fis domain
MSPETTRAGRVADRSRGRSGELEEHLQFEKLISELSVSIVNAPAEALDARIEMGLGRLGEHLRLGLATVLCLDSDRKVFEHTHEWCAEGLFEGSSFRGTVVEEPHVWLANLLAEGREVLVNRFEDLPPEAEGERATAKALGIRSVLWVPFRTGEQVAGYVAYNSIGREMGWTEQTVQRLRLIGQIFGAALDRRQQEAELQRRLRFDGLLSKLSQRFAAVSSGEVESEIERWLEPIGRAIDVELVVVGAISTPNDPTSVTVLTWNAGRRVRPLRPEEVPWLVQTLFEGGQSVVVDSLDDLPREAAVDRHTFESVGIRAFVSVPLLRDGDMYGGMSLCSLSREGAWPDELRSWLGLMGEVFANALARHHAERALQDALDRSRRSEADLREALAENERLRNRLQSENLTLRNEIRQHKVQYRIIGESPAVREMLEAATQVAKTDSTVLILGETGTGKELLAQAIHAMSGRRHRTLVRINCGAFPPTLIESELFGREKGAYTGALTRQKGRFEIADGSTILLDEIAELPLELQPKLLHFLETGSFERLGSPKTLEVDVRLIAATNRDLEKAVEEGGFRQDLFFRLNVFPIRIAPLRERLGDIPLLVWSFVRELSATMGKAIDSIPRQNMAALERYSWPGNVRELRNVIERAMIRNKGPVLEIETPMEPTLRSASTLEDLERQHIVETLQSTGWRVRGRRGAAEILGLKPTTLDYRMKKLGIRRPPRPSNYS